MKLSQEYEENEAQNEAEIFLQKLHFCGKTFFQKSLENFLRILETYSWYSESCPGLALYSSNKIRAIRHTNHIICQKKSKTFLFCFLKKIKLKMRLEYSCQSLIFCGQTFFSEVSKKFYASYKYIQGIYRVVPT